MFSNFNEEMIKELEFHEMAVTEGGVSTLFHCLAIMKYDFNSSWSDGIYLCTLSEKYSIMPGHYY